MPDEQIKIRKLELILDEQDYDYIQSFLAEYQANCRDANGALMLPDGESNIAGAIIAEALRDLDEAGRCELCEACDDLADDDDEYGLCDCPECQAVREAENQGGDECKQS